LTKLRVKLYCKSQRDELIEAELLWDEETIEHIWERHHLTIEEVDEAFHDSEALIHAGGKYGRQVIYGRTEAGRYLVIIVKFESRQVAELVTARQMTDSEKRRYKRRLK
jgi:uncharacterized DUF497 family protein